MTAMVVRVSTRGRCQTTKSDGIGEGKFVVHTPALEHFADQVERLRKPLTEAFDELNACLPLAAGRFKIADQISDDGNSLRETYLRGIATMRDGLQDIEDRVREDAEIFKELEEANTGVVTDEAP